jgi:VCBS repeat-containing protein
VPRNPRLLLLPAVVAGAIALATAVPAGADSSGCPARDPISNTAGACATDEEPVESIDPAWSARFVPPAPSTFRAAATTLCLPVDAVFYAQTDWLRLAQKLRLNPSSCAEYYVSVPPLAADKTKLRTGEAAKIRALGGQFHAMAEINVTGWAAWVAAGNGTWFDAGVEARKRMVDAGFDVGAGDLWAVNEFSSAVRTGAGAARQNMRDLVRGLYTGDGTAPATGLVWVSGIGQPTSFLGTYKTNLKAWFGDGPFWDDMSRYVRFFSTEVYGSVTNWAVPGTTAPDRLVPLADFVGHAGFLAGRAPAELAATTAYLAGADAPTANAAWPSPPYGWPPAGSSVSSVVAQGYVAAQVYALRHDEAGRAGQVWGFAWNPTNFAAPNTPLPDFANQTGSILDRLAAAIHASDAPTDDPGIGACSPDLSGCAGDVDGSAFNPGWSIFHTWTQPVAQASAVTTAEDTPVETTLTGVDPDAGETLSYQIVDQPLHGTVTADTTGAATYTPAPNFNGTDSFTFRVTDGVMFSAAATVTVTVTPVNDAPAVAIDAAGPVDEGATPVTLTAHASDVEGNAVSLSWSTSDGTLVANGDTATFAADDGPATPTVTVTADDGNGGVTTASIEIEVRNVPPTAHAGGDATTAWGVPLAFSGSGTDPSRADAKTLTADWSFGDGGSAVGFDVSHAYDEPGTYVATLTVHDKDGGAGSDTVTVTVGARAATIEYASPAGVNAGTPTVSVQVGDATRPASGRLQGHEVTIGIGSDTCTATTDVQGVATCALDPLQQLGPATLTARLSSDELYDAATVSAPVVVYRRPAGGAFVVGDLSASGEVTFWSDAWWLANRLSGGPAPASFKGFVEPWGLGWVSSPGFGHAPAGVPEWMGVLVADSVRKDGSTIGVDATRVIVVHVEAYDRTLEGRGLVVATG